MLHEPDRGIEERAGREEHRDEGPERWFVTQMRQTYGPSLPTGGAGAAGQPQSKGVFVAEAADSEAIHPQIPADVWHDRLAEFKRRKAAALVKLRPKAIVAAPTAALPPERNWQTLGPSVVLYGQTEGNQPVAGRISGIAIAPGGQIVYAASAAGGVFRSDDGGSNWRSLMDGFDLDPTEYASSSLACGAIAIDPNDPDRIYVGTGEGDTYQLFKKRITNALPSYRGIGPIRSDDRGNTWHTEQTAPGSPKLGGEAFFALAVDPRDREHVLAATTNGLYQRVPATGGGHEWVRRIPGLFSSVVVASSGNTVRFFAAEWGEGVYHSVNGERWYRTGTNFPVYDFGRIALGVQPDNPNLVYAFLANENGWLFGVYRLDAIGGEWKLTSNVPNVIQGGQGDYDLTIAVDPQDENLIYLGGDHSGLPNYSGSIWRCEIQPDGTAYKVSNSASIGTHAHADIHVLMHTPGDPDELWCGCDGGVFMNQDPRGSGHFASRNNGLSCLHCNFIAQHPTNANILYTGLQDNGTAMTNSPPIWNWIWSGDGGYCLINWADPLKIIIYVLDSPPKFLRTINGGANWYDWNTVWEGRGTMTMPIVSMPYDSDPANAANADFIAVGAGNKVWISDDFGNSWSTNPNPDIELPTLIGDVFSLAFASTTRLFIASTRGEVVRADKSGSSWNITRLDDAPAGPLDFGRLITDIAVDWNDDTHESVYVSFGGMGVGSATGNIEHVWRFDGTRWEPRSGTASGNNLLDVEHNALVVDPDHPENLYVGANIGVWHSPDSGENWQPFQNGLPDAPVYDLQIHPTKRLLRAATHGRGVYEIKLD